MEQKTFRVCKIGCEDVFVDPRMPRGPFFTMSAFGQVWKRRSAAQKRCDELNKHFPELTFTVV